MSVVAKFFVSEISRYAHNLDQIAVKMTPVSRGEENKEWSKYTPSGGIQLNILNAKAAEQFVLGEEYLITFEHTPKPEQN
jgi:hypothetical protein